MGTVLSPFGSLLAELRDERRPPRRGGAPPRPRPSVPVPEPKLLAFERRPAVGASLLPATTLLHGAFAVAIVVGPILTTEDLPPPTGTRVYFVEPLLIAPPPPPSGRVAVRKTAPAARATTIPPPIVTPDAVVPEESIALDEGAAGAAGVEEGLPGGVVGGVVGALPEAAPPPAIVRVGDGIPEPTKLRHVSPIYPDVAARARIEGTVLLECEVSPQGRVTDVRVLRGIPLLDQAALDAVRQWAYSPTLLDGVPVRVIMTVTVRFKIMR